MQYSKLLSLTFLVLLTTKPLLAHQSECHEQSNASFNRPCLERLIPRSLDPTNRNMMQPKVVKVSNQYSVSGSLNQDNLSLIHI